MAICGFFFIIYYKVIYSHLWFMEFGVGPAPHQNPGISIRARLRQQENCD